jgi:hypothetical protein
MKVPSWYEQALGDAVGRTVALAAALEAAPPGDMQERALRELTSTDARMIVGLVARRELSEEVLFRLLTHPVDEIRATTAMQFKLPDDEHGLSLPEAWTEAWLEGVMLATPANQRGHGDSALVNVMQHLARAEPDTAERWFVARLDAVEGVSAWQALGDQLESAMSDLPRGHRLRVLDRYREAWWSGNLAQYLCANDPDMAIEALATGVLTPARAVHLLDGGDRATFERIAPHLLDRGVKPDRLVAQLSTGFRVGDESKSYAELREYCERLTESADHRLALLGQVGSAMYRQLEQQALTEEHAERVFGSSS